MREFPLIASGAAEYVEKKRAELVGQIAKLEEVLCFRLNYLVRSQTDVAGDQLFNALNVAIVLMRRHEQRYQVPMTERGRYADEIDSFSKQGRVRALRAGHYARQRRRRARSALRRRWSHGC